jgi:hypothetical protein
MPNALLYQLKVLVISNIEVMRSNDYEVPLFVGILHPKVIGSVDAVMI